MKTLTKLDEYWLNAPLKVKVALAIASGLLAAVVSTQTMPDRMGANSLDPARTSSIVEQTTSPYSSNAKDHALALERMRPMPVISTDDMMTITSLNERTSDILRDAHEIGTRLNESKAWSGDMFTPEQKATNIAQAFKYATMRADHPEMQSFDGSILRLREDLPENQIVNNIIADLNFKRETLRNATLELGALIEAVKEDRQEDVEKHRHMMTVILNDAGYALSDATDWSVTAGKELTRFRRG
jgi:hypothetical protein